MQISPPESPKLAGFTLIELSIVLVIIGLLVGGVLVGRDLIKAAEIRATISQIQKYTAAVNTFRLKYGFLPGDIPYSQATAFGLFSFTGVNAGTTGMGDGNGQIDGSISSCTGEMLAFWRHLSEANLVDGAFGVNGNSAIDPTTGGTAAAVTLNTMTQSLPVAKLGYGATFLPAWTILQGLGNKNAFVIMQWTQVGVAACLNTPIAIPPIIVSQIDSKIDDGLPVSGSVQAQNAGPPTPTAGACVWGAGTTWAYNTSASPNAVACLMFVAIQ